MIAIRSYIAKAGLRKISQKKLDIGTSTVGMWCSGKSKPSNPMILKLFELGVTPKELYGEEIDHWLRLYYNREKNIGDDSFKEGMELANKPMTKDEIIALFKSMKEKGEI